MYVFLMEFHPYRLIPWVVSERIAFKLTVTHAELEFIRMHLQSEGH